MSGIWIKFLQNYLSITCNTDTDFRDFDFKELRERESYFEVYGYHGTTFNFFFLSIKSLKWLFINLMLLLPMKTVLIATANVVLHIYINHTVTINENIFICYFHTLHSSYKITIQTWWFASFLLSSQKRWSTEL